MIIDFHTHVFPDKIAKSTISALQEQASNVAYTDGTVDGMVNALNLANADIAITLPVLTKASQFDSITKFIVGINQTFCDKSVKLISFGGLHPDCDNVDEKMAYLKSLGVKGIKIHPDYQGTFIDDPKYINIIKCAKKYDMIVVTHAGVDDGYAGEPVRCPPERVLNVINEVNYDKLVLAHFGGHKQWDQVLKLLAGKNVYFDTAYTLHEISESTFKAIVDKHGADKILFATDCPWRDIKADVDILKSYNLGKEVEDKIFYKNALKLLGL